MRLRRTLTITVATLASAMMLGGCLAGEDAKSDAGKPSSDAAGATTGSGADWSADVLTIDFATYNPLSLVIKDQGWLEAALGDDVQVAWVQSAGSNKANEALRAGAIDVGSTAGAAALLARANGSPIRTIGIFTQPEWAAIVVPAGSDITSVPQLAGRTVAATKGTDPYFFLLQALEANGVSPDDVEVQNLQHADGRAALENGSVDAWAGLDPIMADTEVTAGSRLIYRNIDFNTYGFLNATEDFVTNHPDLAQLVLDAYEKARAWALAHPDETAGILADVAGIDPAIAQKVIGERTNIDVDVVPGDAQRTVLERIAPIIVASGDVPSQDVVDTALDELFDTTFAQAADPTRL